MKITQALSGHFTVSPLGNSVSRPHLAVLSGALLCLLLATQTVNAKSVQWVWKNAQGVKVYSDLPPPADIPKKNILKSPHREVVKRKARAASGPVGLVDAQTARGKTDAAVSEAGQSELDKKVEEKRKQEEAKKKAEEKQEQARQEQQERERLAKQQANCQRIAESRRNLNSGVRISTTDENGEKKFLSEQEIQSRLDRLDAAAKSNDC